jgi:ribosomal-protein-alanine N-acetyltransferase
VVGVMEIRPMAADDVPAVLALEQATFSQPWDEEILAAEVQADRRVYLVAGDGQGSIVGYGGLLWNGEEAHVVTLASAKRGSGIGTRLMLALVEAAIERGARHLTLEVRTSNRTAQELYRRFGLAPVGIRSGYYGDEDALVMWAHDIATPGYRARLDEVRRSLR